MAETAPGHGALYRWKRQCPKEPAPAKARNGAGKSAGFGRPCAIHPQASPGRRARARPSQAWLVEAFAVCLDLNRKPNHASDGQAGEAVADGPVGVTEVGRGGTFARAKASELTVAGTIKDQMANRSTGAMMSQTGTRGERFIGLHR